MTIDPKLGDLGDPSVAKNQAELDKPKAELIERPPGKPGQPATPEQSQQIIAQGMTAVVGLLYTIHPADVAAFNIKLAMMLEGLRPHMTNVSRAMQAEKDHPELPLEGDNAEKQPGEQSPAEAEQANTGSDGQATAEPKA